MTTRRSIPQLVVALLVMAAGTAAANDPIHSLTGNLRLGFGFASENLAVVPYTPALEPNGRIDATPMAFAWQPTAADPLTMIFTPAVLTAQAIPHKTPVFLANNMILQAASSLAAQWPKVKATLAPSGRTGPATVSFCPGQVVLPLGNPGCISAQGGSHSGRLRYVATSNQFGGPAQPNVSGFAGIHFPVAGVPPCDAVNGPSPCTAALFSLGPPNTVAIGAPFGFVTIAAALAAPNIKKVNVAVDGSIISSTPGFSTSPGLQHTVTSFGGPWTTGMLTVSVTDNAGPMQHIFMLSGSDTRVAGIGSISLVSGSLVTRSIVGTSGNRGWLNLTAPAPSAGLGAAAALGFVGLLHGLLRRRRSTRR